MREDGFEGGEVVACESELREDEEVDAGEFVSGRAEEVSGAADVIGDLAKFGGELEGC